MPQNEIFTPSDYETVYPEGIENHFWNIARNDLIYRTVTPHVEEGDLVMDVGCGTGLTVGYLSDRGINVRGVELGAPPVSPGLGPLIFTETDLFALDDSLKREVKVLMLLDVLEHIGQRQDFLQELTRQFPNCRMLLVTVPARMELWSPYDEHWGHHLRYNRPTLSRELREGGWDSGANVYFFNGVYLASLLLSKLGINKSIDFKPIGDNRLISLFHRIAGFFTKLETRIVPGFIPGSSIACLACRSTDGQH
jgi:hypothetical protein